MNRRFNVVYHDVEPTLNRRCFNVVCLPERKILTFSHFMAQTDSKRNGPFGAMSILIKHAYSNILKILAPKNENFQIKNSDIFYTSAQNIDCGCSLEPPRRGGSNEYPQSMF